MVVIQNDKSDVVEFFENQTVFLTGGTGFVGKVIVEKLLRTCPDINKIYLLIRPKKGKTAQERFNTFFDYPCFEPLKSLRPDFQRQVHLINGDCGLNNLGIASADLDLLRDEVTCVIHSAANVKFDQTLYEAATLVRSINDLIILAKQMKQLKSFVFISTAYSNCVQVNIEEKFYEPPMSAENFLQLIEVLSEKQLEEIQPTVLGEWPNTYVYSKSICEDLLKREASDLPLTIIRPAIITCSYQEPVPGWIDSFYGIAGLAIASGLGIVASVPGKHNNIVYLVPVDHVVNATLVAAEKHSTLHPPSKFPPIYNIVGTTEITWGQYFKILLYKSWEFPLDKAIWFRHCSLTENEYLHELYVFLWQTIPAYIADIVLRTLGKPAIAVTHIRRLNKLLGLVKYFTYNTIVFDQANTNRLLDGLSEKDKILFDFNTDIINFLQWTDISITGGRIYLIKDPLETLPHAKRKMKIHCALHNFVKYLFYYYLIKFLLRLIISFF